MFLTGLPPFLLVLPCLILFVCFILVFQISHIDFLYYEFSFFLFYLIYMCIVYYIYLAIDAFFILPIFSDILSIDAYLIKSWHICLYGSPTFPLLSFYFQMQNIAGIHLNLDVPKWLRMLHLDKVNLYAGNWPSFLVHLLYLYHLAVWLSG